jgi:hypothetical protein
LLLYPTPLGQRQRNVSRAEEITPRHISDEDMMKMINHSL